MNRRVDIRVTYPTKCMNNLDICYMPLAIMDLKKLVVHLKNLARNIFVQQLMHDAHENLQLGVQSPYASRSTCQEHDTIIPLIFWVPFIGQTAFSIDKSPISNGVGISYDCARAILQRVGLDIVVHVSSHRQLHIALLMLQMNFILVTMRMSRQTTLYIPRLYGIKLFDVELLAIRIHSFICMYICMCVYVRMYLIRVFVYLYCIIFIDICSFYNLVALSSSPSIKTLIQSFITHI
jgi:hypothetical protein